MTKAEIEEHLISCEDVGACELVRMRLVAEDVAKDEKSADQVMDLLITIDKKNAKILGQMEDMDIMDRLLTVMVLRSKMTGTGVVEISEPEFNAAEAPLIIEQQDNGDFELLLGALPTPGQRG